MAKKEKVDYGKYMASREWREKRKEVIERQGNLCARCQSAPVRDVHHLSYANVGHESVLELQGLCRPCHEYVSAERNDDPAAKVIWALIEEHGMHPEWHPDGSILWYYVAPPDGNRPSLSIAITPVGSSYYKSLQEDGEPEIELAFGVAGFGLWM